VCGPAAVAGDVIDRTESGLRQTPMRRVPPIWRKPPCGTGSTFLSARPAE
jgi:hypothetical protein